MPSDIFISYSRKDAIQAELLADQLRAEGLEVWIDRKGIAGAEKWAAEIVEGINACSTFALLISGHSIESENVLRELSLASEKNKRVLPITLENVELPSTFAYPLAGLQRVMISDFDAIVYAHHHGVTKKIRRDERKSLMILPFEDLSPTGDNEWFADGIASELISALSHIESLRIADNQATKEFKNYHGQLAEYAREMSIRYFVQGDVRKFGNQIKISARLIDSETGDHLWQESIKGTMADVFDMQEMVANKVVDGLKLHLTSDEKRQLADRGTENAEAYEFYLKAGSYITMNGPNVYLFAMKLLDEAIKIDPNFAKAYLLYGSACVYHYREYARNPSYIDKAKLYISKCEQIEGITSQSIDLQGHIAHVTGNSEDAITASLKALQLDPKNSVVYHSLANTYFENARYAEAVHAQEQAMELAPAAWGYWVNLIFYVVELKDPERMRVTAQRALPLLEKEMLKNPENTDLKTLHAGILFCLGQREHALRILDELASNKQLGSVSTMNVAFFYQHLGFGKRALEFERLAIKRGLRPIEDMHRTRFENSDEQAEHEAITRELEQIIENEKNS
jgi:adenylate cyclase